MRAQLAVALYSLACASVSLAQGAMPRQYPQYILLNLQHWYWIDGLCNTVQPDIDAILSAVGSRGVSDKRRVGIAAQFSLLYADQADNLACLQQMLQLAEANDMPIAVGLDAFEWWDQRPDLWNWWNATAPGYSPDNVANVEWTGWNATSDATAIAWRNWAYQIRQPPHPNLGSATVLREYVAALRPAAAIVGQWYASLPPDKKYLLAYAKVSWEADIGGNYYVYPNANSYIGKNPAQDPQTGTAGAVQVGYAAVCSLAFACSGTITRAQLDAVMQAYFSLMAQTMLDAGIPRSKLALHAGSDFGDYPTNSTLFISGQAALIPQALPGFSFYHFAPDPTAAQGLDVALDAVEGAPHTASEWLCQVCGADVSLWTAAYNATLSYRNARLITIFNYEGVINNTGAMGGLAAMVSQPELQPACLTEPASGLSVTVTTSGAGDSSNFLVNVSWLGVPPDTDALYLDVGTTSYTKPSGAMAAPTLVQHVLVGTAGADSGGGYGSSAAAHRLSTPTSYSFTLPAATYTEATVYAGLVSQGCASATGWMQTMASDLVAFTLPNM